MKVKATIFSFRMYDRVLSDDELAWNRKIDDYRFHDAIPVTNIVVATSRVGFEGNEASGPYEIAGGYVFTAPSGTVTDDRGFEYACAGHTLETWNSAKQCWNEPVSNTALSYDYSVSDGLVRLTWQWKAVKALFAAGDYGIRDYVAGGLRLHYDGIKNIGLDAPDSSVFEPSRSKAWINVAPASGYNLAWAGASVNTDTAAWANGGFNFTGMKGQFSAPYPFVVSPKSTQQALVDGIGDSVANGGSLSGSASPFRGYVFMADGVWNKAGSLSFVCDAKNTWFDLPAHGFSGTGVEGDNSRANPCVKVGSPLKYATEIMGEGYMAAFYGTEIPAANTSRYANPARLSTSHLQLGESKAKAIFVGAGNASNSQAFIGTIKNFRYYDRALDNAELRQNRQVDEARYFGRLAFTNVVVAVEEGKDFAVEPAAGAYAVEGEWTFTAAAGSGDSPTGYKLQTWDEATGRWSNTRFGETTTFTYNAVAENDAPVLLTWFTRKPLIMVVR